MAPNPVPTDGLYLLRKLATALGLGDRLITKIIIVADCNDIARVYISEQLDCDKEQAVADAVKEVLPEVIVVPDEVAQEQLAQLHKMYDFLVETMTIRNQRPR